MDFLSTNALRNSDSVGLAYEPKERTKSNGEAYERHDFADLDTMELIEFMNGEGGHAELMGWFKGERHQT